MNKTVYWAAGALLIAGISGCASSEPSSIQPFVSSEESTPAPSETSEVAEPATDYYAGVPTGPGESCDINSLYTVDCSKQFPEVAYLNAVTRLAGEPLISLPDDEKIALALAACEQMRAGATPEQVSVVDGESIAAGLTNNQVIAGGAVPNFCVELDTSGLF